MNGRTGGSRRHSGASAFPLLPQDRGKSPQRVIDRSPIWEDVEDFRVNAHDVRPLGVPGRGHSTDALREIVLTAHRVRVCVASSTASLLLHTFSAPCDWPAARRSGRSEEAALIRHAKYKILGYWPTGGCQSSTLFPSGSMTHPNLPYSDSSVFSRTLQPSFRSASSKAAKSATR